MWMDEEFEERLRVLREFFDDQDYPATLALAKKLKNELTEAQACSAYQLGLLRYFVIISQYKLNLFEDAYETLRDKEPHLHSLSAKLAAEIHLIHAELATRVGVNARETIDQGQKAVRFLLANSDLPGAVQACNTVCTLLGILREDQLNLPFSETLITIGTEHAAARVIIGGLGHLLRAFEALPDPQVFDSIAKRHAIFRAAGTGELRSEAAEIMKQLDQILSSKRT